MAYYPLVLWASEGGAIVAAIEGNRHRVRCVIQTDPYLRAWRGVRGLLAR